MDKYLIEACNKFLNEDEGPSESEWPKKTHLGRTNTGLVKPKPLSPKLKKIGDSIVGSYSLIKGGADYISDLIEDNNPIVTSKKEVVTELDDWIKKLNINGVELDEYGNIHIKKDVISKSDLKQLRSDVKSLFNQTDYIIGGEKFSIIGALDKGWNYGDSNRLRFDIVEYPFMDSTKDEIVTDSRKAEKTKEEASSDEPYYMLGYWNNPYRAEKEYFWGGPFDVRKHALNRGNRLLRDGQPKKFRDWSGGSVRAIRGTDKFKSKAKAVGLNPAIYGVGE